MNVTSATVSAIVGGVPEVAEQQTNGNTPRVAGRPLVPEGAHAQISNFSSEPTLAASAYLHVTRHVGPGQRTGRVNHTQNATGARQ